MVFCLCTVHCSLQIDELLKQRDYLHSWFTVNKIVINYSWDASSGKI